MRAAAGGVTTRPGRGGGDTEPHSLAIAGTHTGSGQARIAQALCQLSMRQLSSARWHSPRPCSAARWGRPGWSRSVSPQASRRCLQAGQGSGDTCRGGGGKREFEVGPSGRQAGRQVAAGAGGQSATWIQTSTQQHEPCPHLREPRAGGVCGSPPTHPHPQPQPHPPSTSKARSPPTRPPTHLHPSRRRMRWPGPSCPHGRCARCGARSRRCRRAGRS